MEAVLGRQHPDSVTKATGQWGGSVWMAATDGDIQMAVAEWQHWEEGSGIMKVGQWCRDNGIRTMASGQ